MKNSMMEMMLEGKLALNIRHSYSLGDSDFDIFFRQYPENHIMVYIFIFRSGSMKRLASINFGLDEVTGSPSSNEDEKEQRDLFEVVCKQRFSGVHDDDMEKSKENSEDSEETATEEDDPWESRTKEIEFGSNLFSSEAPASTNSERVQSHVSGSTSDTESPLKVTYTSFSFICVHIKIKMYIFILSE